MSLLKLLTTGKSLVGLKDSESRYRMTNHKLLPKFGSAKNPFRAVAAAETISTQAQPPMEEPAPAPATQATRSLPVRGANPGESTSLLRLGTSKCRNLAAAALQSRWASQLGSLLSRPAPKPVKAAAVPVPAQPQAVQGELSLDRIKVVRNDLSDADLEIVAAKPGTRSVPAPVLAAKAAVARTDAARAQAVEQMLSGVNR